VTNTPAIPPPPNDQPTDPQHRELLAKIRDDRDRNAMRVLFLATEGKTTYAEARDLAGLSIGQAARYLQASGWTKARLEAIETGAERPTAAELADLMRTYGVPDFIGWTRNPSSPST